MTSLSVHFSSASDSWETPPDLFACLDREFSFTLDAAAAPATAKCSRFFTEADDALVQDWVVAAGVERERERERERSGSTLPTAAVSKRASSGRLTRSLLAALSSSVSFQPGQTRPSGTRPSSRTLRSGSSRGAFASWVRRPVRRSRQLSLCSASTSRHARSGGTGRGWFLTAAPQSS